LLRPLKSLADFYEYLSNSQSFNLAIRLQGQGVMAQCCRLWRDIYIAVMKPRGKERPPARSSGAGRSRSTEPSVVHVAAPGHDLFRAAQFKLPRISPLNSAAWHAVRRRYIEVNEYLRSRC
jgi:hypothetical protein